MAWARKDQQLIDNEEQEVCDDGVCLLQGSAFLEKEVLQGRAIKESPPVEDPEEATAEVMIPNLPTSTSAPCRSGHVMKKQNRFNGIPMTLGRRPRRLAWRRGAEGWALRRSRSSTARFALFCGAPTRKAII